MKLEKKSITQNQKLKNIIKRIREKIKKINETATKIVLIGELN
jgi:hypothetical protein